MTKPIGIRPIRPLLRAAGQLDDPVFIGVVLRSLGWAAVCFAGLLAGVLWAAHQLLGGPQWLGWLAGLLGSIGAALLAFWLFLPVAIAIGALFTDRVAAAVEQRCYPGLPPPLGAPLAEQLWDAGAIGVRVLVLSLIALLLALLLPGIGALLGWAISAWAIGRGLFVSVAMRRMGRRDAERLHRVHRLTVLAIGAVLALAGLLPPLNLFVPVLGVAAMVHVLHEVPEPGPPESGFAGLSPR